MAVSEVSICNLAISWLGGNLITSLDDSSSEAKLCKANYEFSRNAVLEDRNWSFASGRSKPPKLSDPPEFGYSSAFQLPTNPLCLRVTKVSTSPRFDVAIEDWVKEEDKILVNSDVVYIKYIKEIKVPTKFSPGFIQALAARVAADIAVPLTANADLFANYWQLYLNKLEAAGANDGLQGVNDSINTNQLIRVR